jgi:hypothetical protein
MSQSRTVAPPSVIESREAVRTRVKQRLTKLPEYRAFLAIEKPIAEVADIPDLVSHLQTAKQRILDQLAKTREYQALLTVDKAIEDFSEILDVVGDDAGFDAAPAALETVTAPKPAGAADARPPEPVVVATAPFGHAETAAEARASMEMSADMPETYSRNETPLAAATRAARERPETSIPDTAERRSTLGLVEEWRLTALVRESYSANLDSEESQSTDESVAEAEKTRVA